MHVRYSQGPEFPNAELSFWKTKDVWKVKAGKPNTNTLELVFLITFLKMLGWDDVTVLFGILRGAMLPEHEKSFTQPYHDGRFYKCTAPREKAHLLELVREELQCDTYFHDNQIVIFLLASDLANIVLEKLKPLLPSSPQNIQWKPDYYENCFECIVDDHKSFKESKDSPEGISITPTRGKWITVRINDFQKFISKTIPSISSLEEKTIKTVMIDLGILAPLASIIKEYYGTSAIDIKWEKAPITNPEQTKSLTPSTKMPDGCKPLICYTNTIKEITKHANSLNKKRNFPFTLFYSQETEEANEDQLLYLLTLIKAHKEGFELKLATQWARKILLDPMGVHKKIMSNPFIENITKEILAPPGSSQHKMPHFSDTEPQFKC